MNDWMRRVLESKRAMRAHLAALLFAGKLVILEKLRARSVAIAASRATKKGAATITDRIY